MHKPACLVFISLLLVSCGFHLRGDISFSEDISPVYLQPGSVHQLGREIRKLLEAGNVRLAASEEQAKSILQLLSDKHQRRVLSVDSHGRAHEYLLIYSANYSLQLKTGTAIEDSISVSRSLLFDENAALAFVNESEVVYEELRRDAARRILLKLQAFSQQQSDRSASQQKSE